MTRTNPDTQRTTLIDADTVEVAMIDGRPTIGVEICPRGFANEVSCVYARLDEQQEIEGLIDAIRRHSDKEPGDSYTANWMTRQEIAQRLRPGEDGLRFMALGDGNSIFF